MATAGRPDPADVERWLHQSRTEAERWLPDLLDLCGSDLSQELSRRPELQPGISHLLLDLVDRAIDRNQDRAHELTGALIAQVGTGMPLPIAWLAPYLRGQAWTAHAGALRAVRRHVEALAAIAVAFDVYQTAHNTSWHIAAAEVVEAQILYDLGERADALHQIRRAAGVILAHGAIELYVQVRMHEWRMLWRMGHRKAAAQVWRDAAREASQRRDLELMAMLHCRIGHFQLRLGKTAVAAEHFSTAHGMFEKQGLPREAARAQWGLAEVAAVRGHLHDAISEYYKVQAMLLATGDLLDAAVASVEILRLLLAARRDREALPLADLLIRTFAEAGQENGMQAWVLVRERADAGELTYGEVHRLRRYFKDLPLRPNARFA